MPRVESRDRHADGDLKYTKLDRKENFKFEYKFEIRISKNITNAYHIDFLKS